MNQVDDKFFPQHWLNCFFLLNRYYRSRKSVIYNLNWLLYLELVDYRYKITKIIKIIGSPISMTIKHQYSTYHELHVASSWCLSTGRWNLLAEVSRWDDFLGQSDAVVGEVHTFQSLADDRVVVDGSGDIVEQFDDEFGHVVTRCSLHVTTFIHCITAVWSTPRLTRLLILYTEIYIIIMHPFL